MGNHKRRAILGRIWVGVNAEGGLTLGCRPEGLLVGI